jgi:hypothetical protein
VNGGLLFAVCRGKLSEGIDFSDAMARAVIVVGIPYPNTQDPQVRMKKEFNDAMLRRANAGDVNARAVMNGDRWYQLQAYRAVNQAIGRCIRHRADYGAVVFADERFDAQATRASISKWARGFFKSFADAREAFSSLRAFFERRQANPIAVTTKPAPARLAAPEPRSATPAAGSAPSSRPATPALAAAEPLAALDLRALSPVFGADEVAPPPSVPALAPVPAPVPAFVASVKVETVKPDPVPAPVSFISVRRAAYVAPLPPVPSPHVPQPQAAAQTAAAAAPIVEPEVAPAAREFKREREVIRPLTDGGNAPPWRRKRDIAPDNEFDIYADPPPALVAAPVVQSTAVKAEEIEPAALPASTPDPPPIRVVKAKTPPKQRSKTPVKAVVAEEASPPSPRKLALTSSGEDEHHAIGGESFSCRFCALPLARVAVRAGRAALSTLPNCARGVLADAGPDSEVEVFCTPWASLSGDCGLAPWTQVSGLPFAAGSHALSLWSAEDALVVVPLHCKVRPLSMRRTAAGSSHMTRRSGVPSARGRAPAHRRWCRQGASHLRSRGGRAGSRSCSSTRRRGGAKEERGGAPGDAVRAGQTETGRRLVRQGIAVAARGQKASALAGRR